MEVRQIGEYRLLKLLGGGAYGQVFEAENRITGNRYALKLICSSGTAFRRELAALKKYRNISHPNLIVIHHVGVEQGQLYYTMDLAQGTLAASDLPAEKLLICARKLSSALVLLHSHGLLHRDIKPDNLLYRDGEVILGDIGLLAHASTATFSGTPGFMPRRVYGAGEAPDAASDVYALAKSFYCLLSKNPPSAYPNYSGSRSIAAAQLLAAILSVCDDDAKKFTAAEFCEMLGGKAPKVRRSLGRYIASVLLGIIAVIGAASIFIYWYRRPARENAAPAPQSAVAPAKRDLYDYMKVMDLGFVLSKEENDKWGYYRDLLSEKRAEFTTEANKLTDEDLLAALSGVMPPKNIYLRYELLNQLVELRVKHFEEKLEREEPDYKRYYLAVENMFRLVIEIHGLARVAPEKEAEIMQKYDEFLQWRATLRPQEKVGK